MCYCVASPAADKEFCPVDGVDLPASVRLQESSRLVQSQASSTYSYDYDAGYLDCIVRDALA